MQRCLAPGCYRNPHYGVSRLIDPNSKAQYCTKHKSPGELQYIISVWYHLETSCTESYKKVVGFFSALGVVSVFTKANVV